MASRARAVAPFALTALTAAAGLSLGRVFDSGRFVAPVLAAALLPHGVGALGRRLRWSIGMTIGVTVLVVAGFVLWALLPGTTWFGIPTGSTFDALDHQLSGGWHVLRTAPAPAPVTDGTRLLAVIAIAIVATFADWLAFRRYATLGAISPALVLFVWSSTLGTSSDETLTVIGFGLAAAAFLVVQNIAVLDRRRTWLVVPRRARTHWLVPATVLGVGALAVGLALAPAVPGADGDPLLDFANPGPQASGGRSYNTTVAPLLDVGAKLSRRDDIDLFTVGSPQPDYWRLVALDDFTSDGGAAQWTMSAAGSDEVRDDLPEQGPRDSMHQEYTIGPLGERWLPAAYRAVATSTPALVVTSSSTLVSDADSIRGLRYRVDSILGPIPDAVTEQQKAATAGAVPKDVRRYTELPANFPKSIADEAQRVVTEAGATTPYAQAAALRDWFWATFTYDINVSSGDDTNAIVTFLRERRGFCVQFASTFAVMARSLGIPARVAVGFTPGAEANGTYTVSAHDAHAWPEIYLAGLGWTHLFDPTPPAETHAAAGGSNVPGDSTSIVTVPPPPTAVPTTTTPSGAGTTTPATTNAPLTPRVSTDEPDGGSNIWLIVVAVLAVLVLVPLAYAMFVIIAKSRRRARRRGAEDPAAAVHGAWEEALDRLHEAHVPRDRALTPLELARDAPRHGVTAATRPLRTLARSYSTTRYSNATTTPDDARRAWDSVDEIDRALDTGLSRRERWRRRLDPSTLRVPARRG
jgi:transglutaminase-like putative cysteine protease